MGKKGIFQMLRKFMGKEKGEVVTVHQQSEEDRAAAIDNARRELIESATKENSSYNPATDSEVSMLLQKLSQEDRTEFFRVRERSIQDRRDDETLSQRDIDMLTLRAMQRSTADGAVASHDSEPIRWDDMPSSSEAVVRDLTCPEILLLSRFSGEKGKSIKTFSPGEYFTHEYHLDLNESIKTMFASGLICYADFETCLKCMTVKELKEILAECNLAVGGKKSVLVDRIVTNCDPVMWESRIDRRVMLTDAGRELVEKYGILSVCQNNSGIFSIGLDEAGAMREQHPEWSGYEIVLFILGERSKRNLENRHCVSYRNCLFRISEAHRLGGNIEMQKHYLLQCCFMDANGYVDDYAVEERLAFLAPGLIAQLAYIYKDSAFTLEEDYQEALKALPVPRTRQQEIRALDDIRAALMERGIASMPCG